MATFRAHTGNSLLNTTGVPAPLDASFAHGARAWLAISTVKDMRKFIHQEEIRSKFYAMAWLCVAISCVVLVFLRCVPIALFWTHWVYDSDALLRHLRSRRLEKYKACLSCSVGNSQIHICWEITAQIFQADSQENEDFKESVGRHKWASALKKATHCVDKYHSGHGHSGDESGKDRNVFRSLDESL